MIDDLLAMKTRIDAFISDPLKNPLTRSEQMILARDFSYILNVRDSLAAMPNQEITDHHLQMFINSHENGCAMIVPCKIELLIAKECLERRRLEREAALTKQPNNLDELLSAVEEVLRISDRKHDAWDRSYAAIASIRNGVTAPAQPVSEPYKSAANDIIAERQRQISEEGWMSEHDDRYSCGELAGAAACYARYTNARGWVFPTNPSDYQSAEESSDWPLAAEWWKPTNPRRDLVKAGALILAEIERQDRAAPAQESE